MKKLILATAIAAASFTAVSQACTAIAWNTDSGVLTTRTNDWVEPTSPVLGTIKAGTERFNHGIKGNGDTYKTKYDILAILSYGGLVHDGINSEGMQVNTLYYAPMNMNDEGAGSVSQLAFGEYLIANFATLEEIANSINKIKAELVSHPAIPAAPTFHWSLTDKSGDRLVIEHDKDGVSLYRGEEAMVMTNQPSQQTHLDAWKDASGKITKTWSQADFGSTGNTNPRDRFLHASYFSEQLKQPSSSINGMMKLATTAFRIPHDASNKEVNGVMAGYATEWSLTQNLNTGDAVWEYLWGDTWTNVKFNFYDILESGKDISFKMDDPKLGGDITSQIIASGK
ncbi:linear amide C-N hydrolase [Photobacterium sagamiensis]|uniref:linear amide C-N hydrolase n=1 Tax=Photobacterium sagamiensis TaxID=2910241 RepID=UPI003D112568